MIHIILLLLLSIIPASAMQAPAINAKNNTAFNAQSELNEPIPLSKLVGDDFIKIRERFVSCCQQKDKDGGAIQLGLLKEKLKTLRVQYPGISGVFDYIERHDDRIYFWLCEELDKLAKQKKSYQKKKKSRTTNYQGPQ